MIHDEDDMRAGGPVVVARLGLCDGLASVEAPRRDLVPHRLVRDIDDAVVREAPALFSAAPGVRGHLLAMLNCRLELAPLDAALGPALAAVGVRDQRHVGGSQLVRGGLTQHPTQCCLGAAVLVESNRARACKNDWLAVHCCKFENLLQVLLLVSQLLAFV